MCLFYVCFYLMYIAEDEMLYASVKLVVKMQSMIFGKEWGDFKSFQTTVPLYFNKVQHIIAFIAKGFLSAYKNPRLLNWAEKHRMKELN